MQPYVVVACRFQGKGIVLPVVPPNQNLKPAGRNKTKRRQRGCFLFFFAAPDVPLLHKLLPDLCKLAFCVCPAERLKDGIYILQFLLRFFNLHLQYLLSRFCSAVVFIIFLCILRRGKGGVEFYAQRASLLAIKIFQFCKGSALFYFIKVCLNEIAVNTQGFTVCALGKLCLLCVDFSCKAVRGVC